MNNHAGKRRRLWKKFLIGAIVLICLALSGWRRFAADLGEFLVHAEQPERAEAILVLGGDFWGPRVIEGADLGIQGFAPRVLISGPPYQNRPESELAIEFLVKKSYPKSLFVSLPIHAKSTIDEAIELAPMLRRLNIHDAILVTRDSHSRRAAIVFRLFCSDVHFRSVPAVDEFQPSRWWTDRISRKLFYLEWSKILGTVFLKYPEYLANKWIVL